MSRASSYGMATTSVGRKDTTNRITSKKEWGKFSCKPKLEIDIFLIYNNLKHLQVRRKNDFYVKKCESFFSFIFQVR